ncbi:hypothetical protein A0U40_02400 [[Bacillus] sp. KCTC 13219]|nr:hypothetical protein A0U40_02400 [[Bacillus] sp. KCTC 13219]
MFKNFREEMKKELEIVQEDLAKDTFKVWQIDYNGHTIRVVNAITEETLAINNVIVDCKKRDSIFKQIVPFVKLQGNIVEDDGSISKVTVKLGGFMTLNCIIKVNDHILLQEKYKISLK